jgi:hypothetical protein
MSTFGRRQERPVVLLGVCVLVLGDVADAGLVLAEGVLVSGTAGVKRAGSVVPLRLARIEIRMTAAGVVLAARHQSVL